MRHKVHRNGYEGEDRSHSHIPQNNITKIIKRSRNTDLDWNIEIWKIGLKTDKNFILKSMAIYKGMW